MNLPPDFKLPALPAGRNRTVRIFVLAKGPHYTQIFLVEFRDPSRIPNPPANAEQIIRTRLTRLTQGRAFLARALPYDLRTPLRFRKELSLSRADIHRLLRN